MIETPPPLSMLGLNSWSRDARLTATASADSFAQVLDAAGKDKDRETVREAATQLVSITFIMPMLASLRDSPFVEPPFAPGHAEKQFRPMLDQEIADRIAGAANFPLVDAIVNRLLGPPGAES